MTWTWVNLPPVSVVLPSSSNLIELVGGNLVSDVDPCPARNCVYSAIDGQAGVMAYSGMAFAPTKGAQGSLIVHGGGHADYWGNELYVFDLATKLWSRLMAPSVALDGTGATTDPTFNHTFAEYADGTPGSSHTFDHLRIVPASNELLLTLSVASYGVAPWSFNGYSHACNLTTGVWRRASTNAANPGGGAGGCTCYDPVRNRVWWAITGGFGYYDVATETHTQVSASIPVGFDPVAFYYAPGDSMIIQSFFGSASGPCDYTLTAIELSAPTVSSAIPLMGNIPPQEVAFVDTGWGVDWSPDHNAAFCLPGDPDRNSVYRIDPPLSQLETDLWTLTKIALPQTLPLGQPRGVYSRWRYCSTIRKFAYVSKTTNQVVLYTP